MYRSLAIFTVVAAFVPFPAGAEPIELSPKKATAVLWAHDGKCSTFKGEADKILCEEVASSLRKSSDGQRYFRRRRARVTAGVYGRGRSIPLSVESCIYCEGVRFRGRIYRVVGRTRRNQTMPAPLRETAKVFPSEAAATDWVTDVLPRLVTDLWFEIPASPPMYSDRTGAGLLVDIKAYRVYDPCTGEVVAATPSASKVAPDEGLCAAASAD